MARQAPQNVAPQGVRQGQGRPQGYPSAAGRHAPQGQRPMPARAPQSLGRPMPGQKPGAPAVVKGKKKRNRKESDFFYINRKGTCFLIFLFLLISVVVIAANFLGCLTSLKENSIVKMAVQYTAVYQVKDMTPTDSRAEDYVDQTVYVSLSDLFFGALNGLTASDTPAEEVEKPAEEVAFDMSSKYYDGFMALAEEKEFTEGLPLVISKYAPFAIVLFVLVALWYMIKAFAALLGKRVFKNFGLGSILMLVSSVAVLLVGISLISIYAVEQGEKLSLQFSVIGDFFGGAFQSVPKDAAEAAERAKEIADAAQKATAAGKTPAIQVPFVAGYGQLIMLALPVLTLVLSLGARRKIPYSIFD